MPLLEHLKTQKQYEACRIGAPGDALDQILIGDVPSRLQKHTGSLYQFVEKVYPTLYQFFVKVYRTLYISSKNLENRYRSLYQNCEN